MSEAPMPIGPPRTLPLDALFMLGAAGHEEGFVPFLVGCRDDGFTLWIPGDEDLSRDEWEDVAMRRVRTLMTAWDIYKARLISSEAQQ